MRPKKRILLVDTNPDRMGCMRFLLETRSYAVLSASTAKQAGCFLDDAPFPDLMLTVWPLKEDLAQSLNKANHDQHVPWLLIGNKPPGSALWPGDAYVTETCPRDELLERIQVMTQRKRGPRKGFKFPPVSVGLVDELEESRA